MNEDGVIIPYDQLGPEALQGLVEDFVTKHGTDTGYAKKSLQNDVKAVKKQLRQGKALIVYDQTTGTCNIVHREDLKNRNEFFKQEVV